MIYQISETRQPFQRRHNRSCVYYGIRGDRHKYLYDKSCVLEGDLGDAALVLDEFLSQLIANAQATVFVSKGEGSGAGEAGGVNFIVIPQRAYKDINAALVAAGLVILPVFPMAGDELFVPDAGGKIGTAQSLLPIVKKGRDVLATKATGMSTKAKVFLGLGAIAVVAGVAIMATGKTHTDRGLRGARGRRRRKR